MSTEQMIKPHIRASGACLCGRVKYEVDGRLRPVIYCHCEQCRRTSGHYVAASSCELKHLTITVDDGLKWFRSSPAARRGFCGNCGASLFWRHDQSQSVSIMAGTLDLPTGLKADVHIFVADAADYYSIDDHLPQHADYGPLKAPE